MTLAYFRLLAVAVTGLAAIALCVAACGGDDSGGATTATGTSLSSILASPIASVPAGLTVGTTKKQDATTAEKSAGATGVVRTLLTGATSGAYIDFIAFPSESAAAAYDTAFAHALPAASGLAFLPYLPSANCANGSSGGTCGMAFGSLYVVTVSSAVEGPTGAGVLESAVSTYLGQPVDTTAGSKSPVATATKSNGPTAAPTGPCALLTAADAQTALNGPVGSVRQGGDTCSYPGRNAGSSAALEVYDTGKPGFNNARSETQGTTNLTGVGDSAFVFASQAGFVQVFVLKGNTFFVVTVANDQDSQRQSRAVALAKTIASRVK